MGLFSRRKARAIPRRSLADHIKHDAPSDEWFVWKYPHPDIRLGSQLIVHESQEAVFFKSGQALDVFPAGTHTLSTGNLPGLGRLIGAPFGGKSPLTAEVWYVNRHVKRDMAWGTPAPIPLLDPAFNVPVSVRAFGKWGFRISDSKTFLKEIVGTLPEYHSDKIRDYFVGEITQKLGDALSRFLVDHEIPILQLSARTNELSSYVRDGISSEFLRFGLEVVNFHVQSISLPTNEMERLQKILGDRMEIEQLSQISPGEGYKSKRSLDVLEKAAENENGAAGALLAGGLGLGAGLGAGAKAGGDLADSLAAGSQEQVDPSSRLRRLKQLLNEGLIDQDEFRAKKQEILRDV